MLGSDIGSVLGGLINNGRSLPTVDIQNLLATIAKNKQSNESLINQLPESLRPLYAQYQASLGNTGTTLQGATTQIGQNLLDKSTALYDPNGPAAQATLAALKQQDYSTLPGTLNSLRSNLAATGGLARGGAGKAITQAVLAPAAQYSQQAATVQGQQLTAQQNATQQALNKIASIDDATANSLFGMSKEQATQILSSGRQDLRDQLTQLVNNNNAATSTTLGAYGIADQNAYQNAVTRNNQQAAVTNGLVNLGVDGVSSLVGSGGGAGGGTGFDPATMSTPTGTNANPSNYGI